MWACKGAVQGVEGILAAGYVSFAAGYGAAAHPLGRKKGSNMKKKALSIMMAAMMVVALAGCGTSSGDSEASDSQSESTTSEAETSESTEEAEGTEDASAAEVMTYAEYIAADVDTAVTIEGYVQAKQSWYEDTATVYLQDEDGAYFLYGMACSEEDYENLTVGTKIKVSGYKSEWSGEVEIIDATFEFEDGTYVAEALDVTDLLGTDELIDHQNEFVSFTGMTVEDSGDGAAFLYSWDGSGSQGDDLYFNVSINGETYTFTVESYLCDSSTEVYQAVEALEVGDVIDMEGFLYWYEGVNPHITSVTVQE